MNYEGNIVNGPDHTNSPDVFISHCEEDRELSIALAKRLEDHGYKVWYYERDSIIGQSYFINTSNAIVNCKAFLLLISRDSLSSHQITKEVVRAAESGKQIFPLLLDISHLEFQNRQPEWREAIGSATSIKVIDKDIDTIAEIIIKGFTASGIFGNKTAKVNYTDLRVNRQIRHYENLQKKSVKSKKIWIGFALLILLISIIGGLYFIRENNHNAKVGNFSTGERYAKLVDLGFFIGTFGLLEGEAGEKDKRVLDEINKLIEVLDLDIPKYKSLKEAYEFVRNSIDSEYEKVNLEIGIKLGMTTAMYYFMQRDDLTVEHIKKAEEYITEGVKELKRNLGTIGILDDLESSADTKQVLVNLMYAENLSEPDFDLLRHSIKMELLRAFPVK